MAFQAAIKRFMLFHYNSVDSYACSVTNATCLSYHRLSSAFSRFELVTKLVIFHDRAGTKDPTGNVRGTLINYYMNQRLSELLDNRHDTRVQDRSGCLHVTSHERSSNRNV